MKFGIIGAGLEIERFAQVLERIQATIYENKLPYKSDDPGRDRTTVSIAICSFPAGKDENGMGLLNLLEDGIYNEKIKNGKNTQAFHVLAL